MNELSARDETQVSGTGDYEMTNRVRAAHSVRSGEEKSRRSCDVRRMRAAIEHGGLEKAYTVSSRTTIPLISLEIDELAVCRIICPWRI